jgi:hypothetical protein
VIRIALLLLFASTSSGASAPAPPPPCSISWDDFYARVSTLGLEYSATLHDLEGKRVRLRGFSIPFPKVPGGVLLSRNPYSDPHDVDETDVPYDAVGVLWREDLALPPLPGRPTVEGTLRLGNHDLGEQTVSVLLEDAVPVLPDATGKPR